jgi:acetyl-CoA carboxylase biotin carboxyl carrier protein
MEGGMMHPQDVAALAGEMAAAGITRLKLAGPNYTLTLERAAAPDQGTEGPESEAGADLLPVIAPALGNFLRTHPLHDKPLAVEGEALVAGQAIALLRVGALLTPVPAPADGMIVGAVPEEGALVGYGDRLFDFLPQD